MIALTVVTGKPRREASAAATSGSCARAAVPVAQRHTKLALCLCDPLRDLGAVRVAQARFDHERGPRACSRKANPELPRPGPARACGPSRASARRAYACDRRASAVESSNSCRSLEEPATLHERRRTHLVLPRPGPAISQALARFDQQTPESNTSTSTSCRRRRSSPGANSAPAVVSTRRHRPRNHPLKGAPKRQQAQLL